MPPTLAGHGVGTQEAAASYGEAEGEFLYTAALFELTPSAVPFDGHAENTGVAHFPLPFSSQYSMRAATRPRTPGDSRAAARLPLTARGLASFWPGGATALASLPTPATRCLALRCAHTARTPVASRRAAGA